MITEEHKTQWLALGYDPVTFIHRKVVIETILKYNPGSVLDVGCATGADLALLHLAAPHITLKGFDIHDGDVRKAKEILPTAFLFTADLKEGFPEVHADVVFSNGVIMYHTPLTVKEMLSHSSIATILNEKGSLAPYAEIISKDGFTPTFTLITTDIRESWGNDGWLIEIPKQPQ